ncbi:hypothetical protein K435DRAFT_417179 [Dendrothele bispora CBS 962.96]|uniref:ARID domain-containing protein n=1 Tax=Dendrothele bispora (strain CBS 962.96) TaxID=1314807 RepID=A0A4S8MV24_DENBC|nr:hypothetical protein K435DRAFT_417179 [Dendrothele bispora CBS 962.96]
MSWFPLLNIPRNFYTGHGFCDICTSQIAQSQKNSPKTCPMCRGKRDNAPHRVFLTPAGTATGERAELLGHALNTLGPDIYAPRLKGLENKMRTVTEELSVDQMTARKLLDVADNMKQQIAPLFIQLQIEQKEASSMKNTINHLVSKCNSAKREGDFLKNQLEQKNRELEGAEELKNRLFGQIEAQRRENEKLKGFIASVATSRSPETLQVGGSNIQQGTLRQATTIPIVNQQRRPRNPDLLKERILKVLFDLRSAHAMRKTPLPPPLLGISSPNYDHSISPFKDIQLGPQLCTICVAGKPINMFALFAAVLARGGGAVLTNNNTWSTLLPSFCLCEHYLAPDGRSMIHVPKLLRHHYNLIFSPIEHLYLRQTKESVGVPAPSQSVSSVPVPTLPGGLFPQSRLPVASSSGSSGPSSQGWPSLKRGPDFGELTEETTRRKRPDWRQ